MNLVELLVLLLDLATHVLGHVLQVAQYAANRLRHQFKNDK